MEFGDGVVVMAGGRGVDMGMEVLARCALVLDAAGQCTAAMYAGRVVGSRLKGSHCCCEGGIVLKVSDPCGNSNDVK